MADGLTQEYYDDLCRQFNIKECHIRVETLSKKKMAQKMRELIARCKAELEQDGAADGKEGEQQQDHVQDDQKRSADPEAQVQELDPAAEEVAGKGRDAKKPVVRRGGKRAAKQTAAEETGDPAGEGFTDSHDKYPKSSPESFGSEPLNTIQADQTIIITSPVQSDDHRISSGGEDGKENVTSSSNNRKGRKERKSPVKSQEQQQQQQQSSSPSPQQSPVRRHSVNTTDVFIVNRPPSTSAGYDVYFMQKHSISESEVLLDRLDDSFIQKAKSGLVKWKNYFKNPALELARLAAAEEPENDPEYVTEGEEEDVDYDMDDVEEDEGSDFEKELVAITRSQEATLKRERFSPTTTTTTARTAKKNTSGRSRKRRSANKDEDEEGLDGEGSGVVKGEKVKRQRRIVLHKCNDCTFSNSSIKELKIHLTKHGIGLDPIICKICGSKSFSTFDDERHQYEAHEGPAKLPRIVYLSCTSCKDTFPGEKEFDCHVIHHILGANNGYRCTFGKCDYVSLKYDSAAAHVKTHTRFKCTFCDKTMQKMQMLETHCSQEHKQFGRPFQCCLCDFRCAVYGLIVKHKEESHAIIMEKESEMCRFCFHKSPRVEHVFNENEKDKKLEHLAIHANFDQLYKCKEPDCGFAADDISLFHDHNFQNHIATVLTDEVSWEFNLPALVQALSQAIKKKFNKKQTARLKPNTDETNSAIEALAGFLTDPEYTDESRSFVSGDLELDAGILSSGDFAAPPAATQNKNRHHHQDTSADFADNDEDGENLVPRERPKRKSAIEAQSRLQKQKEEEAAERLRKERRRAQLFTHTPQPASASASATTSSYPHPASASSDDAATPLPPAHSSNHNNNSSNSNSPPSAAFLPSSAGISSLATGSASRCEPMFSTSPFASSSSPSKGPAIENIIRSLDMQENDAIPSEVLNDVFMDPMGSADTVSPFVYDPTTRHIMYQDFPVLDEDGSPMEVPEELLAATLNMLYSQTGLV